MSTAATVLALIAGCAQAPGPGLARGKQVFTTCVPCHGASGAGNLELRAPEIGGLPEWYVKAELTKFRGAIRGAHPDDMEGARMRPMAKTLHRPGDLESVAAYVATLPHVPQPATLEGDDRTAGEARFTGLCVTCHGAEGKGNQDLGAPPIVGQADWYLYAQLQKFKSGLRGAHPEDVTGAQMAAMASTLEDTTAMRNVIAYIRTLGK